MILCYDCESIDIGCKTIKLGDCFNFKEDIIVFYFSNREFDIETYKLFLKVYNLNRRKSKFFIICDKILSIVFENSEIPLITEKNDINQIKHYITNMNNNIDGKSTINKILSNDKINNTNIFDLCLIGKDISPLVFKDRKKFKFDKIKHNVIICQKRFLEEGIKYAKSYIITDSNSTNNQLSLHVELNDHDFYIISIKHDFIDILSDRILENLNIIKLSISVDDKILVLKTPTYKDIVEKLLVSTSNLNKNINFDFMKIYYVDRNSISKSDIYKSDNIIIYPRPEFLVNYLISDNEIINDTCVIITTHGKHHITGEKCDLSSTCKICLEKVLYYLNGSKIILFANEVSDEWSLSLKEKYKSYNIDIIYVNDQKAFGGLSGTWNVGTCMGIKDNKKIFLYLNNDTEINESIYSLLRATTTKLKAIYGPISNNPSTFGNNIDQLGISPKQHMTLKTIQSNINGFAFALNKETLISNTLNNDNFFDQEKYPFGKNEVDFCDRLEQKYEDSFNIVVESCYIKHLKLMTWK